MPSTLRKDYVYTVKPGTRRRENRNKKTNEQEKIHQFLNKFGIELATLAISIGTLVFVWMQTDISKQAMRIGSRPYVGIDNVTWSESSGDAAFSRTFIIKNSGQTPAYYTRIVYKMESLSINSTHSFPGFGKKDSIESKIFMPAGGTKSFDLVEKSYFEHPDSIKFFVHGIIEYSDIFNEHHFTEFGFRFASDYISIEYCKDHNRADQVR